MIEENEVNNKDNKSVKIETMIDDKRISTQLLLQQIYKKLEEGYREFEIDASGQHNIGGPLWTHDGSSLKFKVKNPGQRVGSMGLAGTQIIIEGSAPADVGWLNSGAEIILKGDGGDTTAHCAASGKIYVAGKVGTRSGALMKHDPKFSLPEFWVLKNTGSFSFEFMSGGIGVICGYHCEEMESVLSHRACVGMVGGTIYVRGNIKDVSSEVWIKELNVDDTQFLTDGLKEFTEKIERPEIYNELLDFTKWHKIVAKNYEERKKKSSLSGKNFRENEWVEDGIFGDLIKEDWEVNNFVETGDYRLKVPEWQNLKYSAPCEYNCPIGIPTQKRISLIRDGKIKEAQELVLEYSPFPASVCGQVCPNLCMENCNRKFVDVPVKVNEIGLLSKDTKFEMPKTSKKEKIAVIGSGAAGLSCGWQLKKLGYNVDVFEQDKHIGGKLKQVIPSDRLSPEILESEIARLKKTGMNFHTNKKIDKNQFEKLSKDYDAVVIAVGAHNPVVIPFEGSELLVKGLDFLKAINNGEKVTVGKKVVVIGAGNAAMDVVIGAYNSGAEEVTAIDIQKPAAFDKEIKHVKKLGAQILYPCFTEKITEEGVYLKGGEFLEADTVIIAVGDRPEFDFVGENYLDEKGRAKVNEFKQSGNNSKVFFLGDTTKAGLFTDAIADGKNVAFNIDNMLEQKPLKVFEKRPVIPCERVKKEYYPTLMSCEICKIDAQGEKDRCLSCGQCRDCKLCMTICPEQAISRAEKEDGSFEYVCDDERCIGCGICAGICPCGIWTLLDNFENEDFNAFI